MNGESILMGFMGKLGLKVGKFIFQNLNSHQDNVLGFQSSRGLNVEEKFVRF